MSGDGGLVVLIHKQLRASSTGNGGIRALCEEVDDGRVVGGVGVNLDGSVSGEGEVCCGLVQGIVVGVGAGAGGLRVAVERFLCRLVTV